MKNELILIKRLFAATSAMMLKIACDFSHSVCYSSGILLRSNIENDDKMQQKTVYRAFFFTGFFYVNQGFACTNKNAFTPRSH